MEDIAVYCSWADAQLDAEHSFLRVLPTEVRSLLLQSKTSQYFHALTSTLRDPRYTDALFPLYKPLLPELLARWTAAASSSSFPETITTISCLARVLPLATYLRPHIRALICPPQLEKGLLDPENLPQLEDDAAQSLLLALFRCLSFERDMLADRVGPLFLSSFLRHSTLHVRYLAIQCLCMTMHFADAYSEKLVETYIGKQAILGFWEGRSIDYRLLKLWEERRWKNLVKAVESVDDSWQSFSSHPLTSRNLASVDISPQTANLGGVLHPRIPNHTAPAQSSMFVLTATAKQNLHEVGKCLADGKPILICGQASSGKTSLVHEAARLVNQRTSMITLHLNDQTDAKSLLGIHTSSADGNSFIWEPGVLTKAMQQGSWVLIEDIDRAPPEVMGVLRPLLENGELYLASRKEKIRPKDEFRILATMKINENSSFNTASRYSWLHNPRIWNTVETSAYPPEEVEALLRSRYPAADVFVPLILRAHQSLLRLHETHPSLKGLQTRKPTLRDLLNLTRRSVGRLHAHVTVSESTALPEQIKLDIFKDAVDCYAGYLNLEEVHELVASSIAASMDVSPQQMRYCLTEAFASVAEDKDLIRVGRSTLQKVASRRRQPKKAPFALTSTTRRTLDRIAVTTECAEPCLLVGETGVGKTTMVQHVANLVGQVLTVINLSQQSEAGDLLGGLKPVTTRSLVLPVVEKFNTLFNDTFSAKRNEKFQIALAKAIAKQNWPRLMLLWDQAIQMAAASLKAAVTVSTDGTVHATKKRKLETSRHNALRDRWADFSESFKQLRSFVDHGDKNHAFAFVEGRLVQAVREGEWVLLDEINLAPSDTLDHIASLLQQNDEGRPSLLLAEAGNIETIVAHPNFRLFAAMNPATDAGKKDLASGLRSRFTEIYVPSGDSNLEGLTEIIQTYLGSHLDSDKRAALDLARSYLALKKLNEEHRLTDGAGETPHFSIRSLVRCLLYVLQHGGSHGLRRAMYEGFAMSFFTVLSCTSENLALPYLESHLLSNVKNRKAFFNQQPKMPHDGEGFIAFRHHLVQKGPMTPDFQSHYIRTPSVERNLLNLARAASMKRFPILLQGPTSAGKTSMVEYLAKLSGNKFVRINNHEHTDLQEYLGSYVSAADGKLAYQEGVLVDALRLGHWIVLDELNLAPSDVLEALNRLLDDNRELLIPESQEIVRPHPNFMMFATQNPAGLYGGRKRLSRAFRNRFLEIHFDDIPEDELEVILRERSQIAPPFCTKIVAVYKSLSLLRQSSRLFEQRNSFATLRDLFRWASRPVDDLESLAYHGFLLLAERVRDPAERVVVKRILEKEIKVTLDEHVLYNMSKVPESVDQHSSIVWTPAMRRVFVLVAEALKNREPVLLVGETGCGKTQICQVVAEAFRRPLDIYNAHTNTETGDLIGSQRPVRNRTELANTLRTSWRVLIQSENDDSMLGDLDVDQIIEEFTKLDQSRYSIEAVEKVRSSIGAYLALFSWNDGSLVRAMKKGQHFLLDEISLAEDSVLERLNSVLEPSRTMLLAEKGSIDNLVTAHPDFQFLATMNPGGDYGKRELSAALRNRLTEIWMPPLSQEADILPIVQKRLSPDRRHLAEKLLKFAAWFHFEFHNAASKSIALRDLLAWADFINIGNPPTEEAAFVHGGFMVYVDSIGANPAGMTVSLETTDLFQSRQKCLDRLQDLIGPDAIETYHQPPQLSVTDERLFVGQFSLPRAPSKDATAPDLVFDAPTTLQNTMRIVRALQMTRPILLEGSPGVGKTAIVTALAQACGKQFSRINLSDQTDLMDLFGADAPSENEEMGKFSWQDGPLLKAMQTGGWILLDEMNLASQSVLEGLNACLDHRREVYVAELDRSFACHPDFTLFAAQNPHHQGGGRKGLPASFVNRFTIVYADPFQHEDLIRICRSRYPNIINEHLEALVTTVTQIGEVISRAPAFAQGGPWDVNLRDVNRWLQLYQDCPALPLSYHLRTVITERLRSPFQREKILAGVDALSGSTTPESFYNNIAQASLQVGTAFLARDSVLQNSEAPKSALSVKQLPAANSVIAAVGQNWPIILAGPSGAGKTTVLRHLAAAAGVELVELSMNADVDAMDLVGGFEQYDLRRDVANFQAQVRQILRQRIAELVLVKSDEQTWIQLLKIWQYFGRDDFKIEDIQTWLPNLLKILPGVREAIEQIRTTLQDVNRQGFRFVWNDGVLVDALKNGSWLVLDNANLCNPSVLDRLNSLLEPDGMLTVSEQHNGEDGTRVIKPHPNFRIFMTMDPRYGELSRAMRNRSLEVFLPDVHQVESDGSPLQYPLASTVGRLRLLVDLSDPQAIETSLDNLNDEDMALMSDASDALPETHGTEVLRTDLEIRKSFDVRMVHQVSGLAELFATAELPQLAVLNEPLILLSGTSLHKGQESNSAELFIRAWYTSRRMAEISTMVKNATVRSGTLALKDRTILERSASVTKRKDLSLNPNVATFAQLVVASISALLQTGLGGLKVPELLRPAEQILAFTQEMLRYCNRKNIDHTHFHAYLQIGAVMVLGFGQSFPDLALGFSKCLETLSTHDTILTTGFGLQLMWQVFRPKTSLTLAQLDAQLALEELIARFDQTCRYLPELRSSLSKVRSSLRLTYRSIIDSDHPENSLQVLQDAIGGLEIQSRRGFKLEGHFEDVMGFVHGVITVQRGESSEPDLELLSMFTPLSGFHLLGFGDENPVPVSLARLASFDTRSLANVGSLALQLSRKLSSVQMQPLGMMNHAKEELQVLANALSSHTDSFENLIQPLTESLRVALGGIMFSHAELLTQQAQACFSGQGSLDFAGLAAIPADYVVAPAQSNERFREVYLSLMHPVLLYLVEASIMQERLTTCLIKSSLAGLVLMVPDKPFDPATYPTVEYQFHERSVAHLNGKIEGQRQFHRQFTGQETALVIRSLEKELLDLGTCTPPPTVIRPGKEQNFKLQEVLTKIVTTVLGHRDTRASRLPTDSAEWMEQWSNPQGKSNVRTIIERLENVHRAYDDFAKPILWFLKCLYSGLELASAGVASMGSNNTSHELVVATPLLSSSPIIVQDWRLSATSTTTLGLYWLEHAALKSTMAQKQGSLPVDHFLEILNNFYHEWKTHLTQDQAEAVTRSRYYAYRGDSAKDDEDEDLEMADMFPEFDSDGPAAEKHESKWDARAIAVKLSTLHQKIYSDEDPQDAMQAFIMSAIGGLSTNVEDPTSNPGVSFVGLLPAVLLQMDSKMTELRSSQHSRSFNIYTDSDVRESQRLFDLVRQIQMRFYTIQEKWPEHAVPADVISFCAEVLHLSFGDPVAKYLTKTEKLLEIVSQWQSIASREWSVSSLVESLTALIISWRRLELLSWSRLLDEEKLRHENEAQAWYFIAYEAVIYNLMNVNPDEGDIQSYRKSLVQTLEEFFRTTTLGQYSSRLRLLSTLNTTLQSITGDQRHIQKIAASVQGVIDHYRRYEAGLEASLQTNRMHLEKALNEQIKLASWKDTNITALRESARRSHHKLFKIVRKYRALLNQVVVLNSPDELGQESSIGELVTDLSRPQISEEAVAAAIGQCQLQLQDWNERPQRLVNPLGAARSMQHLYISTITDMRVHQDVAFFRQGLGDGIKELRSQTPSTLTEDNASFVRHLQERKRRLLADTLKKVAHMGIRRNLATSELEKQSSTAAILAFSTDIMVEKCSQIMSAGDSAFHDLLDNMPQVRIFRTEHSDDLTDGEVNRCVGLLEGLLSVVIHQRQMIPKHVVDLEALGSQLALIRSITFSLPDELTRSPHSNKTTEAVQDRLAWLAEILTTGCHILRFQKDHGRLEIEGLIDTMQSYAVQIKALRQEFNSQRNAPPGMGWEASRALLERSSELLHHLDSTLRDWQVKEPRVKFLLSKIIVWTEEIPLVSNGIQQHRPDITVHKLDGDLKDVLGKIFVALQRLSASQLEMPQSDEDPGWLIRSDKLVVEALRSLQIGTIVQRLDQDVLARLQYLSPANLGAAKNLLTVAMPIIEQFYYIGEHLHQRQNATCLETCRLALHLAKSFTALASQGFCRPVDPAHGQDEQSGKLESGTGLGEGEGAEDISKDVQDDEDLSELAQQGHKEEKDAEIENADDAVDMDNEDLEGEMGDFDEKASDQEDDENRSGDDDDEKEIDEETGSVDDLDPDAVDEKMWDDMKNESEQKDKEMKNDKAKGQKSDDQTAAEGEKAEDEDMDGMEGDEQEMNEEEQDGDDGGERPEGEQLDAHVDEEKALDLPEELNLAGADEAKDEDISDDGMDELSDVDNPAEEVQGEKVDDTEKADKQEQPWDETVSEDEIGEEEAEAENAVAHDDEIMEDQPEEPGEDKPDDHETRHDDAGSDVEENAGGESGAANEVQDNINAEQAVEGMNDTDKEPNPQQSQTGKASENEEEGKTGKGIVERGTGRADTTELQQNESLRKLADVLDQWYQRREILPASDQENQKEPDEDVDMADADFEHVSDEEQGNTQALGAAGADQAQNLDQSKAIEDNEPAHDDTALPDVLEPEVQEDIAARYSRLKALSKSTETREAGAMIPERQSQLNASADHQDGIDAASDDLSPDIEHLELGNEQTQPAVHPTSAINAAQLWHQCSTGTHQFSLILTEQLRLILSPTTATKLRGDFRTGKRLNIKRIIPYIASNYKRDKIWMRRSVPSKRNYQIMIAVDDSKSMSESGADVLAFETLALLTKSLAMLEVGEICVVGFGDAPQITVAHPFGMPFSPAESGPNAFQAFSFEQRGTNVKSLLRQSIQLFRDAKQQRQSGGDEQWQLQLIVSDGHISDHEATARLVRQAHDDERIVIVFVIVDAGQESILDLKEAVYERDPRAASSASGNAGAGADEMKLRMKRYLDGFPFPYYLVVRDVRDLPGVLATALKGWFGSVVDAQ